MFPVIAPGIVLIAGQFLVVDLQGVFGAFRGLAFDAWFHSDFRHDHPLPMSESLSDADEVTKTVISGNVTPVPSPSRNRPAATHTRLGAALMTAKPMTITENATESTREGANRRTTLAELNDATI